MNVYGLKNYYGDISMEMCMKLKMIAIVAMRVGMCQGCDDLKEAIKDYDIDRIKYMVNYGFSEKEHSVIREIILPQVTAQMVDNSLFWEVDDFDNRYYRSGAIISLLTNALSKPPRVQRLGAVKLPINPPPILRTWTVY